MRADGLTLPYAWNHTITYEESLGHMPYLVQELRSQDMTVEVLPDQQSLTFTLNASISPGEWGWVSGGEMVWLVGGGGQREGGHVPYLV